MKKNKTYIGTMAIMILGLLLLSGCTTGNEGNQFVMGSEACVITESQFKIYSFSGWFKTIVDYECEESSGTTTSDKIEIEDVEILIGDGIVVVKPNGIKTICTATSTISSGIEGSKIIQYDECEDGSSGSARVKNVIWLGSGYV